MPEQIALAAYIPGVNDTTVRSDPDSGSQIDFASFEHLARTAERGPFDGFLLAEDVKARLAKSGRAPDAPKALSGATFVLGDTAADGLAPHIVPERPDAFAAKVVPLPRERGVFRSEYTAGTPRADLGPARTPS